MRNAMPLVAIVAFALPILLGAQTTPPREVRPAGTPRGAALPKAVTAACDAAHNAVARTPGTKERRRSGLFGDEALRAPIASCRIDIDGLMKQLGDASLPTDSLTELFWAQKWTELPDFSADGPDGISFAYRKNSAACLVRGQWDGGADDEPNAPPADHYTVIVLCGNAADFVRPQ